MHKGRDEPQFRFELVQNGIKIGEAYPLNKSTLRCNADAEVKISFSGNFVLDIPTPNWLKTNIRPYLIRGDDEERLGEYMITQADYASDKNGLISWELKGMDFGQIPKRAKTEERVVFKAGEKYTDIVQSILLSLGIQNILTVTSDAVLANDRADWEIGTSYLKIINALLEEINYQSVWFDMQGNARISPMTNPKNSAVQHEYLQGELSEVKKQADVSSDIFKAYNVFVAMVSSPEYDEPLVAIAENNEPTSKISTVNIGRIQAPIKKLDDISSLEELQKYVDNLRLQSMRSMESVSFRTSLNVHQVRDLIALDHPICNGIYQEIEWKMTLSHDGEMTHTAEKVVFE